MVSSIKKKKSVKFQNLTSTWPRGQGGVYVCLFDLILYIPSTIFQLNKDRSSWVEPVLSQEKVEFWPTDPIPRVGLRWGGVWGQNICYHVAAFVILFNLICNMTMFWKSLIFTFWPHPLSPPRGWDTGLQSKITFDMFIFIVPLSACEISLKILTTYCEI